eukprot:6501177-Alexandrium_andersonii.AAC.1
MEVATTDGRRRLSGKTHRRRLLVAAIRGHATTQVGGRGSRGNRGVRHLGFASADRIALCNALGGLTTRRSGLGARRLASRDCNELNVWVPSDLSAILE